MAEDELTACGMCIGLESKHSKYGLEMRCLRWLMFDCMSGAHVFVRGCVGSCKEQNHDGHCLHFKAREPDSADDNPTA